MPRGLPRNVKQSLAKAQDVALLAIEGYNKPAIRFRSGGYVVLMNIAWTSLFHAIFFRNGIKPFHRRKNSNRYEQKDGDYCYWELKTCLSEYYGSNTTEPTRVNLEFFIPLRNKLEHKSLPEIDGDIFAECQACLFNFDNLIRKEFGEKYCLRECLSFALQLFPSSKSLIDAVKANPGSKSVVEFIKKYRSGLSPDILASGQYSFKAFLVQVANHKGNEVLPVQFIKYDDLSPIEKRDVERYTAIIKDRMIEKNVTGKDLLLPGEVVAEVQLALGNQRVVRNGIERDKMDGHVHIQCWKFFGVRPKPTSETPEDTQNQFCIYDRKDKNYGYTKKWVEHLVQELSHDERYQEIINYKG